MLNCPRNDVVDLALIIYLQYPRANRIRNPADRRTTGTRNIEEDYQMVPRSNQSKQNDPNPCSSHRRAACRTPLFWLSPCARSGVCLMPLAIRAVGLIVGYPLAAALTAHVKRVSPARPVPSCRGALALTIEFVLLSFFFFLLLFCLSLITKCGYGLFMSAQWMDDEGC